MGIVFRPIKDSDRKNTSGVVRHTIPTKGVYDSDSVESMQIFSDNEEDKEYACTSIYSKRGRIEFAIPVLNFFLAGDNGELISKLLGIDLTQIVDGRISYDRAKGKQIYMDRISEAETKYTKDILVGGAYIRYLIENFDIEERIRSILYDFAVSQLPRHVKRAFKEKPDKVGTIHKGSGQYWLLDEYYFNMNVTLDEYEEREFIDSLELNRKGLIEGRTSKLALLLNIRGHKDKLLSMVQDYMIVLPYGYRPTIDKRRDPITKAYNNVVKYNIDLITTLQYSNATVKSIYTVYRELVAAVKHVTVKSTNLYDKRHVTILDTLIGKTGHIRDKMQGARSDYTGRSVIVVDPKMSIDTIGIPRNMATKLMELGIIQSYKTRSCNKREILKTSMKPLRAKLAEEKLEGGYAVVGRQPTLYYLGVQGFKVKIVTGNAIVLNPLSTPAYNADFDGDQMHAAIPISQEAQREVETLMSSANNMFTPRNGDLHTGPRQEILYGIWMASRVKANERSIIYKYPKSGESYTNILDGVCVQKINVYDIIEMNDVKQTAGMVAIRACFGEIYRNYRLGVLPLTEDSTINDAEITSSWLKVIIKDIATKNKPKFIPIINNLVRLGFAVSEFYPPNLSILDFPDVSSLLDKFDANIREREEWYNMGFETEESFASAYDKEYAKLESDIKNTLKKSLGDGNGYIDMVVSGARGSMSNVLQLFGMKGRVMKNDNEAFNAIIRHPMSTQLTGLEHFVTAYGARKGIADKVIATYEPGYIYRQMSHTTPYMVITSKDCGTTDGLLLDYDFLKQFVPQEQLSKEDSYNNKLVRDFAVQLFIGRYVVGIDHLITKERAVEVYNVKVASVENGVLFKKEGIKLRSPITCKNPCCVRCYGIDLGTNAMAVSGYPIGFVAAQAVGEPGTQLTMKNFQSGGVAGVSNLTSSFDLLDKYLNLSKFKPASAELPITYDFIAPKEGYIETVSRGNGTKQLKIMNYNAKGEYKNQLGVTKVVLYEGVKLKDYVHAGESIQQVQGDLSISEIMKYRSPEEAQRYLTLRLYNIFHREVDVNLKHFEVIVASMTSYICTKGNETFKAGNYYTLQEYWDDDRTGCQFIKTLKGTKDAAKFRTDFCSSIFMEDIRACTQRAILTSGYDSLTNPLVRASFGLNMGIGSDIPGYIERRGKV